MIKTLMFCLLALGSLSLIGCAPKEDTPPASTPAAGDNESAAVTVPTAVVYCGLCGELQGTESCCNADAEKCELCGLQKGSALCCRIEGDAAGKDLCAKCGHIAGSDACCQDECEICDKCGLHVDSPLCCKLVQSEPAAK